MIIYNINYYIISEKKLLLQSACGTCSIINFNWLIRCYLDKCYIPESPYEITSNNNKFGKNIIFFQNYFKYIDV